MDRASTHSRSLPLTIGAVTDSAALAIGLTCSTHDWDVVVQSTLETALDVDVLVLDLGTTAAGLEALTDLSESIPSSGRRTRTGRDTDEPRVRCVVLGDEQPEAALPAGVVVLLRPYTLTELQDHIDVLLSSDADPEITASARAGRGSGAVADADTDESGGWTPGTLVDNLFGRLRGGGEGRDRPAPEGAGQADEDIPVRAEETWEAEDVIDLEGSEGEVTAADGSGMGPVESLEVGTSSETLFGTDDEDGPTVHHSPADPPPGPPAISPPKAALSAPVAATDELSPVRTFEPQVIELPPLETTEDDEAPGEATRSAVRGRAQASRWFARRQKPVTSQEAQLRERLARVLAATSEVERLIAEVPVIGSLDALAAALVFDLASQLDADSVALWRANEKGGWSAFAHSGLTWHESGMPVPSDHPLFREIDANGGAILIDPVDAVQEAVVGIGGAHTESFMAASISAGPARFGILAVGRDDPLKEADLDRLVTFASEAAPGIAVAEQLARLVALGVRGQGEGAV
jgi:hypothetical protein